jgi:hypothetical protein
MLIVGSLAGRSLDLTQPGRVPAASVNVNPTCRVLEDHGDDLQLAAAVRAVPEVELKHAAVRGRAALPGSSIDLLLRPELVLVGPELQCVPAQIGLACAAAPRRSGRSKAALRHSTAFSTERRLFSRSAPSAIGHRVAVGELHPGNQVLGCAN